MKNWIYNSAIIIESYLNYFNLDPTIERIQKSPLLGYYINKSGKRVYLNRKRILKNISKLFCSFPDKVTLKITHDFPLS